MKNLFNINKWFVIITLVLYLTFFLGALFQMVLGVVQILMSIYILTKLKNLNYYLKLLFSIYCILTSIVLILIFTVSVSHNLIVAVYLVIPMLIAFFHLFITYKIRQQYQNLKTLNHEN